MRYTVTVENGKQEWESIWSVPSRWRLIYSVLFGLQVALVFGLVIWYETVGRDTDSLLETVLSVGRNMAPMVITIAGVNLIITEGVSYIVVLSESFRLRVEAKKEALRQEKEARLREEEAWRQEQEARRQEEEARRQEWIERVRAEGRAEMAVRIQAWNERRLEAQRLGQEFTEPPPQA